MTLELHQVFGNLVMQEADFIVNASNTKLILGSGVSMAIRRHCGMGLQQEMNAVRAKVEDAGGIIKQGDVLQTSSAGAKNFSYILHAAVMNYGQGVRHGEKQPSLATIERILVNCIPYFERGAESGKQVVAAFPYLGCGVGGLDKRDVLQVFESFVAKPCSVNVLIKLCDLKN